PFSAARMGSFSGCGPGTPVGIGRCGEAWWHIHARWLERVDHFSKRSVFSAYAGDITGSQLAQVDHVVGVHVVPFALSHWGPRRPCRNRPAGLEVVRTGALRPALARERGPSGVFDPLRAGLPRSQAHATGTLDDEPLRQVASTLALKAP